MHYITKAITFVYREIIVYLFRELKGQPKLMLATSLEQTAPKKSKTWVMRLRGWTKEKIRRALERLKVTPAEWFACMWEYDWTCLHCGNRNFLNLESGKEKLDYDHIVAISNEGWTGPDNRQPLCASFNRNVKRRKTMDFRPNWVNGRFVKRV